MQKLDDYALCFLESMMQVSRALGELYFRTMIRAGDTKRRFYGPWITAAIFVSFGITVGVPYYGMPFFYDYFTKEFGWTRPANHARLPLGRGSDDVGRACAGSPLQPAKDDSDSGHFAPSWHF